MLRTKLDERLTADQQDWQACLSGTLKRFGRRRMPSSEVYLVVGGSSAHQDLRDLEPDLLAAASSLTYFLDDGHDWRKAWKLPAKGSLIARIDRRGRKTPSKYRVKVVSRGDLVTAEFEEALMAVLDEQSRGR